MKIVSKASFHFTKFVFCFPSKGFFDADFMLRNKTKNLRIFGNKNLFSWTIWELKSPSKAHEHAKENRNNPIMKQEENLSRFKFGKAKIKTLNGQVPW